MKIHCEAREMPIEGLKTHPKNRNKHSKEQIERLCKILTYQGWRYPIKVSNLSGFITSGHGRLMAARKLGLKTVPVSFQDYDSDEQEYADVQSDNAIASWAELDMSMINEDIGDLGPDFDLELLGIKNFTVDVAEKGLIEDDEVPEVKDSFVKLGDLWRLGDHRLLCGDSTDVLLMDALTDKQEIDLLLTDPPYGMSVVKADGQIGGDREAKAGTYKPIIGDDKPFEPQYLLSIAKEQIIFGANHFSDKLPTSPHWIVWYKEMPEGNDFSGAELAWTSIDKKAVKTYKFTWAGMTRQGNRKDELTKRVHPTQKPVGLFESILKDYEGKTVIDLYGGSGSTLIACEKTKRKCFMMELDPHYCAVIIERWQQFTGQKAERLNAKETP